MRTFLLRLFRKRRWIIVALLAIPPAVALGPRGVSALAAQGRIYTVSDVPNRPVAIIFGAQVYPSGNPSPMLADRIAAGAELYKQGKVKALLLTGDNHVQNYNEPEAMRRYALSLGVPDDALVLDYAGFRTYDSCYRARDVFKVKSVILVTQAFHLDRALMTCNALGVDAIGIAADVMRPTGYARSSLVYSRLREFPSTALSMLDLLRGKRPTYLGDPLPILAAGSS